MCSVCLYIDVHIVLSFIYRSNFLFTSVYLLGVKRMISISMYILYFHSFTGVLFCLQHIVFTGSAEKKCAFSVPFPSTIGAQNGIGRRRLRSSTRKNRRKMWRDDLPRHYLLKCVCLVYPGTFLFCWKYVVSCIYYSMKKKCLFQRT